MFSSIKNAVARLVGAAPQAEIAELRRENEDIKGMLRELLNKRKRDEEEEEEEERTQIPERTKRLHTNPIHVPSKLEPLSSTSTPTTPASSSTSSSTPIASTSASSSTPIPCTTNTSTPLPPISTPPSTPSSNGAITVSGGGDVDFNNNNKDSNNDSNNKDSNNDSSNQDSNNTENDSNNNTDSNNAETETHTESHNNNNNTNTTTTNTAGVDKKLAMILYLVLQAPDVVPVLSRHEYIRTYNDEPPIGLPPSSEHKSLRMYTIDEVAKHIRVVDVRSVFDTQCRKPLLDLLRCYRPNYVCTA